MLHDESIKALAGYALYHTPPKFSAGPCPTYEAAPTYAEAE